MKKLLLAMCILVFAAGCATSQQTAKGPFEVVNVKEIKMSKADIYKKSLLWIAETFRSASKVIEHKDPADGVIIGNGAVEYELAWMVQDTARFKMQIEIKENKYRIIFKNAEIISGGRWVPVESANRGMIEPKLSKEMYALAADLYAYLQKPDTKKDW